MRRAESADKTLEADYTAGRIGLDGYLAGLIHRYTKVLPFRHFTSRHAAFVRHLRMLFKQLNQLSREDAIYRGSNGLPTSYKAGELLQRLPPRAYFEYGFARRVSHSDLTPPARWKLDRRQAAEWLAYVRDVYAPNQWSGYAHSPWAARCGKELSAIVR